MLPKYTINISSAIIIELNQIVLQLDWMRVKTLNTFHFLFDEVITNVGIKAPLNDSEVLFKSEIL